MKILESTTRQGNVCRHFNGKNYRRNKARVYVCTAAPRNTLARDVWIYHKGEIPKRYCVVHRDGKKYNDDISNLKVMTRPAASVYWQLYHNMLDDKTIEDEIRKERTDKEEKRAEGLFTKKEVHSKEYWSNQHAERKSRWRKYKKGSERKRQQKEDLKEHKSRPIY